MARKKDKKIMRTEEPKIVKAPLAKLPDTALKLAYCDGPPYYYKVAYDEAVSMLDSLS